MSRSLFVTPLAVANVLGFTDETVCNNTMPIAEWWSKAGLDPETSSYAEAISLNPAVPAMRVGRQYRIPRAYYVAIKRLAGEFQQKQPSEPK